MIHCFGLYLMSACSVHTHRNKAVLLFFALCFLFLSLSFYFDLCCIICCATSIPRNNSAYPFHAFLFWSLLLYVLLSTLMNMLPARWFFYVILGHNWGFITLFFLLPLLLFFFLLLFGGVVEFTSFGCTGFRFLEIITFTAFPSSPDAACGFHMCVWNPRMLSCWIWSLQLVAFEGKGSAFLLILVFVSGAVLDELKLWKSCGTRANLGARKGHVVNFFWVIFSLVVMKAPSNSFLPNSGEGGFFQTLPLHHSSFSLSFSACVFLFHDSSSIILFSGS